MADRPYFPMFVDLSRKRALVVGGGRVAVRRAGTLSRFCGSVTVVAPQILPEIEALAGVQCFRRPYEPEDLTGADLVLAATDDPALNAGIVRLCREKGIPVNASSDPALCDFFFPGVACSGPVVVGVTASGSDHRLAAEVTRRAWAMLDGFMEEDRQAP